MTTTAIKLPTCTCGSHYLSPDEQPNWDGPTECPVKDFERQLNIDLRIAPTKVDDGEAYVTAKGALITARTIAQAWFDTIDDEVYEVATRRAEKEHGVGLTGFWEDCLRDGDITPVETLVHQVAGDISANAH